MAGARRGEVIAAVAGLIEPIVGSRSSLSLSSHPEAFSSDLGSAPSPSCRDVSFGGRKILDPFVERPHADPPLTGLRYLRAREITPLVAPAIARGINYAIFRIASLLLRSLHLSLLARAVLRV